MDITESSSKFDNLETMPVSDILRNINEEDKSVPLAVERVIPIIQNLVEKIVDRMKQGGRIFYIGAGTSGRLGVLDASEIPPTFGASPDLVIGLIAGGDSALRKAVEEAEDNPDQSWQELIEYNINKNDTLIGIAASGKTPYVIGGIQKARKAGILTACITSNPDTQLAREAEIPIEVVVGPEFVTGSTRMKSGTAQKLVLNMITTTTMIKLGRIKGNKMVDMQLTNKKLVQRGTKMIVDETGIEEDKARQLLLEKGSVRKAIRHILDHPEEN